MNTNTNLISTIRLMNWTRWDYDTSEVVARSIPLQDFVNELAMTQTPSPTQTTLDLLVKGTLTAVGQWHWRAFRDGEHYQNENHGAIPRERWEVLAQLQYELDNLSFEDSYNPKLSLDRLGVGTIDKFYWNWREQQFSYAVADEGWPDDAEELFSVSDICLLAPYLETDFEGEPQALTVVSENKGGRPATYEWEKAVANIVFKWADEGGWEPTSQSDVARALGDWFAEQGASPSDSLLKTRAKWLFPMFNARKIDGQ